MTVNDQKARSEARAKQRYSASGSSARTNSLESGNDDREQEVESVSAERQVILSDDMAILDTAAVDKEDDLGQPRINWISTTVKCKKDSDCCSNQIGRCFSRPGQTEGFCMIPSFNFLLPRPPSNRSGDDWAGLKLNEMGRARMDSVNIANSVEETPNPNTIFDHSNILLHLLQSQNYTVEFTATCSTDKDCLRQATPQYGVCITLFSGFQKCWFKPATQLNENQVTSAKAAVNTGDTDAYPETGDEGNSVVTTNSVAAMRSTRQPGKARFVWRRVCTPARVSGNRASANSACDYYDESNILPHINDLTATATHCKNDDGCLEYRGGMCLEKMVIEQGEDPVPVSDACCHYPTDLMGSMFRELRRQQGYNQANQKNWAQTRYEYDKRTASRPC